MRKLGFFTGLFIGMIFPLLILGGEIHAPAKSEETESFYAGLIFGILSDIALVIGLIFLFKK